jgi:hypothetical protein
MNRTWRIIVERTVVTLGLLILVFCPLTVQVAQSASKLEALPKRVLLLEVPFISWNEATKLKYTDKDIPNQSFGKGT